MAPNEDRRGSLLWAATATCQRGLSPEDRLDLTLLTLLMLVGDDDMWQRRHETYTCHLGIVQIGRN